MAKFNYIKFITEHKHGIEELGLTNHYVTRKTENTVTKIFTSMSILGDIYDREEFKTKLIKAIQNEIDIRLKKLEQLNTIKSSNKVDIAHLIISPTVYKDGVSQPVNMEFMYSPKNGKTDDDGKIIKVRKLTGSFVVIVRGDALITFMEIGSDMDEAEIEAQVKRHNKTNGYPYKEVKVIGNPEFIIDIDTLMRGARQETNTVSIENLPYKVRTDYRKGATLNHKKYGKRKIINTSSGTGGDPGISGKLEWVEIEVDEYPDTKAKVMRNSIKIPNIYTQSYFI